MRLAAVLGAGMLVAPPWYFVARTIADAKPVPRSPATLSGVVWGDRVFLASEDLGHWLRRHGASYGRWQHRHPPASRVLAEH